MNHLKIVTGFNGDYLITSDGDVWSNRNKKFLKPYFIGKKQKQYKVVDLNDKTFAIHRLVALSFIPNPNNYPQINHIDGNRLNNNYKNLEWCTQKINTQHSQKMGLNKQFYGEKHGGSKLSTEQVNLIRKKRLDGLTYKQLSEQFKTCTSNIGYICKGVTRLHG